MTPAQQDIIRAELMDTVYDDFAAYQAWNWLLHCFSERFSGEHLKQLCKKAQVETDIPTSVTYDEFLECWNEVR